MYDYSYQGSQCNKQSYKNYLISSGQIFTTNKVGLRSDIATKSCEKTFTFINLKILQLQIRIPCQHHHCWTFYFIYS